MEPLAPTPAGVNEDDWTTACDIVRTFCRWHIAPAVRETVTLDGSEGHVLFLPTHRVTAIHSISNDGTAVTTDDWSESGMVRGVAWSTKFRSIVVDMTHGHDECPADVLRVVAALAKRVPTAGLKSKTAGPFSETYAEDLLQDTERARLAAYRIEHQP
jgi:hypothetical protein